MSDEEEIIKQGWLFKLGAPIGSWKKRWVVLTPQSLNYSESPGQPWLGRIQIPNCQAVKLRTEKSKERAFVIVTQKRGYILLASSSTEARAWIETLHAVIGCNGAEETKPTAEVC